MFSVGKDFRSMLGNIQYNETGKYIPNGFYFCTVLRLITTSVKVVLNNQVHLLHRNRPYSFSRGNITCSLWTNECFRSGFEQETKRCSWKTGKYTVCDGEGSDWTAELIIAV